ncbi:MAG: DNA polymerase III subunit psi [Legionellaceae bacterium]|nr:DNA polymerase III subunit psi [Legionellaceae bacterium]
MRAQLSHKQTYYLQTMGIEPWVMRHAELASESSGLITVVIEQRLENSSQKKLMHAMFQSIGVSDKMLDVLYDSEAKNLNHHIQKTKPRVVIALGCKVDVHDKTPVFMMHHPADLLQNPSHKRDVYHALGRVASCLIPDINHNTSA